LVARSGGAERNADFATEPAEFPVGLLGFPRAILGYQISLRRDVVAAPVSGTISREEGLRILTSPRREASLFILPGIPRDSWLFSLDRLVLGTCKGLAQRGFTPPKLPILAASTALSAFD
jgi:hypothetical protein